MTRGLLAGALLAALCLGAAPLRAAEAGNGAPFELVRSLQDLQEQGARGNTAAPTAQATLMAHIAKRLAKADAETWADRRNIRALVTYLLSGGAAQAVRTYPDKAILAKPDDALLKGAIAYATGRGSEALPLLAEVDPRSLPSSLGGHVAFVRATLMRDDLPGALAMLDLARLLAPGTLVEEAALRREVFVIGPTANFDKFIQLSRQYLTRFPRSVYADNFLEGFAGSLMQMDLGEDAARFASLDAVIAPLSLEVRRELYLQIARSALTKGRIGTARFAAGKVEPLAAPGSLEAARAKLYAAAGLVVTEQYDGAVARLDSIAQAPFARPDAELRDAVTGIARRLRQWPETAGGKAVPPPQGAPSGKLARSAATIDLAEKAAAGAEALLREKKL